MAMTIIHINIWYRVLFDWSCEVE